jgi:Flp pilus assembly protein TadD
MLNAQHDFSGAQVQIEAVLKINPNMAEAHDLLGTLLERQGLTDAALNEYGAAVRLRPGFDHAQLNLGGILANKGDKAAAREHLQVAARSSDPAIRDLAERLLKNLELPK